MDILPLGPMDPLAVSIVAANLQAIVGLNTDVLLPRPDPQYAYIPQRKQYDAIKIVKEISAESRGAPLKLGITEVDVCTPILTFVFGESQLGGNAALISLHRIKGDSKEETYERAAKIGVHETGHIFGLEHCWEVRCLMHFSRDLEQLDALPLRFCPTCNFEISRRIQSLENC